jgi:hypothetical protein
MEHAFAAQLLVLTDNTKPTIPASMFLKLALPLMPFQEDASLV